jgi:hypothetical protein
MVDGCRGTGEGWTALSGPHALAAELRVLSREDSNLRHTEVTALFTTGRWRDLRGRSQLEIHDPGTGDAETPACRLPCKPGSALAAELPAQPTPGGIRTRDLSWDKRSNRHLHHGPCKELAGNERCCCCPLGHRFGDEVTDIFTTAMPMREHRQMGTLGNRRYRLSVTATQVLLSKHLRCGA